MAIKNLFQKTRISPLTKKRRRKPKKLQPSKSLRKTRKTKTKKSPPQLLWIMLGLHPVKMPKNVAQDSKLCCKHAKIDNKPRIQRS